MRSIIREGRSRFRVATVTVSLLLAAVGFLWFGPLPSATASDWPQYRGPNHDGTSPDRINTQWDGSVTNAVWRVDFGAAAYSSLVVSEGAAVTQVYSNSHETCIALSITNGAPLWATPLETGKYNYPSYPGPRSTPAIDQGSVYVLTSNMKLFRLNFTNGAVIWSNNLAATLGATVITYNNAASPLLDGGLVYVDLGTSNALAAFWATNGSLAWQVQTQQMTHSTPIATTINGVRQVIFATQNGLVSLDGSNGLMLWNLPFPFPGYNGVCLGCSPVVYSNLVFISESYYPTFSLLARIDFTKGAWSATQLWNNQQVGMIWMTPVCYQGAIYGPTGNNDSSTTPLVCLDLLTGTQLWSYQGFGRGSVTLVDNNLILGLDEAGTLHLISPNTNAYTELASFPAFASGSCWNSPAMADGKLYARTTTEAACFDLSMPDLKLDRPQVVARGMLQLTVRAANGAPVNPDRLAAMQVLATTNPAVSATQWTELTNSLALTNGAVQIDDVEAPGLGPWFFMVSEPR